ncbi:ankyrin repeat-containing domain protein [Xylariomycetidae sp. FL2044]|nr:ankyrin repeat-containing domain protein [Xylariomycetidae sp. FL2044]
MQNNPPLGEQEQSATAFQPVEAEMDRRMDISRLSDELIVMISSHLDDKSNLNLTLTNRKLRQVVKYELLKKNVKAGCSALRWACAKGNMIILQDMLHAKASKDMVFAHKTAMRQQLMSPPILDSSEALTPLITAICYQQTEIVDYLIDIGADVNFSPDIDHSAPDLIGEWQRYEFDNQRHYSPLHWAVNPGNLQMDDPVACRKTESIVKALLGSGADVNRCTSAEQGRRSRISCTPLGLALANHRTPGTVVPLLLESGAKPVRCEMRGDTYGPLEYLCMIRHSKHIIRGELFMPHDVDKLEHVLSRGALNEPQACGSPLLHMIISQEPSDFHLQVVGLFLKYLPEGDIDKVDTVDSCGLTALSTAIREISKWFGGLHPDRDARLIRRKRKRCEALFTMLLTHGASPDGVDGPEAGLEEPLSPLGILCEENRPEVPVARLVEFFLKNGASPDGLAMHKPLHYAAGSTDAPRPAAAKALLDYGASVDVVDENGLTPLMIATVFTIYDTRSNALAVAELLLSRNASISGTDSSGRTVLHRACQFGDTGLIETLISHGADVTAVTDEGNTVLHECVAQRYRRAFPDVDTIGVIVMLQDHGCPPNSSKNNKDETAVQIAIREGHPVEVLTLLY